MKKTFPVFIWLLTGAAPVYASGLPAKDSLQVKANTLFAGKTLPKVSIEIFVDSTRSVHKFESDSNGICSFALPLNSFFIIKFSKPGFVSKILTINTATSDRLAGKYRLEFSVEMLEYIPSLDFSIFKKPAAKIIFNSFSRNFEYDREYGLKMRNEMKALYDDYIRLLENDNLQSADSTQDSTTFSENFKIIEDSIHLPEVSKANAEIKANISFCVQVIALSRPLKNYAKVFKGFGEVREYRHSADHRYKYYVGSYKSIYDAQKLLIEVRKFFPHAFIISFRDGERIDVPEGIKEAGNPPADGEAPKDKEQIPNPK